MKKLLIVLLFTLLPTFVFAQSWEYLVIFLPGTAAGGKVEPHESGGYLDIKKTQILNSLAKDGWEVISVTGQSGADHAVYLRKEKDNPK